jgi:hypothetical protein
MREHIAVFDQPPQFGRGVPEYYNLQVFDVPNNRKDRVTGLLKHLGFVVIEEESVDKHLFRYRNAGDREEGLCIYARYHAGKDILEYDNFWEKKETIELEIDRLPEVSH